MSPFVLATTGQSFVNDLTSNFWVVLVLKVALVAITRPRGNSR